MICLRKGNCRNLYLSYVQVIKCVKKRRRDLSSTQHLRFGSGAEWSVIVKEDVVMWD